MGDFQLEVATVEEIHGKPSEEEASNGSWMSHESRGSSMRGIFGRPMGKQKQNQKQLPAGHESTLLIVVYKSTQRSVDGERPPSFLLPMETGGGQ